MRGGGVKLWVAPPWVVPPRWSWEKMHFYSDGNNALEREGVLQKLPPFAPPPKMGAPASHAGERWGAPRGATVSQIWRIWVLKIPPGPAFPSNEGCRGSPPVPLGGVLGELGLSLDSLMAGTGLRQHISCERRTERDYFLVFFLFSGWGRQGGGSLRKKTPISSGNGVKAGIPGIWCCGATGASRIPPTA